METHEHSNHPDFKCVLDARLREDVPDPEWTNGEGNTIPSPLGREYDRSEDHALIYTDGDIALTLFEYCYAVWSLHTGQVISGSLWKRGEWILTKESIEKALQFVSKKR